MQVHFLTTDHGEHPAEKWAEATAYVILPDNADMPFERRQKANALRAAFALALVPHHSAVQGHERAALARKGWKHLDTSRGHAEEFATQAMHDIAEAAKGTPWEADYAEYTLPSFIEMANAQDSDAGKLKDWVRRQVRARVLADAMKDQPEDKIPAVIAQANADVDARDFTPEEVADEIKLDPVNATLGTRWELPVRATARRELMFAEIVKHMRHSMRIDREWHCHRNRSCEKSQAWLKKSRANHPDTFDGERDRANAKPEAKG